MATALLPIQARIPQSCIQAARRRLTCFAEALARHRGGDIFCCDDGGFVDDRVITFQGMRWRLSVELTSDVNIPLL
ncbi:hypothetical protein [Rhabdochromatium marinum]|uniref:hypothetical protein n=1 Tax=Rhabdochromatium marinum TaxID=48729 RepID=UPI0019038277|nr:hypothetical protein [Rhabdochromatium marinum]MBK1650140.1 hypothetical protein [Rhabdochromatium marinum]